jgi:antitoxin HigA-1
MSQSIRVTAMMFPRARFLERRFGGDPAAFTVKSAPANPAAQEPSSMRSRMSGSRFQPRVRVRRPPSRAPRGIFLRGALDRKIENAGDLLVALGCARSSAIMSNRRRDIDKACRGDRPSLMSKKMSIKREDIDRRKVDLSDVRSGRRLRPVHPGEILRDEFLTPMGISVYELAHALKVPRPRANDIVRGRRAITTDAAMRLGRYFGMTLSFGSTCRPATISMSPIAASGDELDERSSPSRLTAEAEGVTCHFIVGERWITLALTRAAS